MRDANESIAATSDLDADLILVGGGLANGLIAWRLLKQAPASRVLVLEAGPSLGGNHTWSFHPTDLTAKQRDWIAPLVVHRWDSHEVIFPGRQRCLKGGYASITSERFAAVVGAVLGQRLWTDTRVAQVAADSVVLSDGRVLRARAVIDGRGVRASRNLVLGFQKFLGQELQLAEPHGLLAPILMDATVAQQDGYRFVYVLPLGPRIVLIEDTFYADGAAVDPSKLRTNIRDYAHSRGWKIESLLREEHGVLPIVLAGSAAAFWNETRGVAQSGLSAGLFHPTTGYSLPDAVDLADLVEKLDDRSAASLYKAIRHHALARWHARGFFRLLNRMLFFAAVPARRWRVMQRFYGLPEPLIVRFYAARLRFFDKLRIVTGKPPVPFTAGVRAAMDFNASRGAVNPP